MNVRVSLVLVVLLALVGGYVLLYELRKPPSAQEGSPWVYGVDERDLQTIAINYQGQEMAFARGTDGGWLFANTTTPVNMDRWGGITLLLSGPRSSRELASRIDDPAKYGLAEPQTVVTMALVGGRSRQVLLGDLTPDGQNQYARVAESERLFLISSSWGEVMNRLVTEPPYPTPTPEGGAPSD